METTLVNHRTLALISRDDIDALFEAGASFNSQVRSQIVSEVRKVFNEQHRSSKPSLPAALEGVDLIEVQLSVPTTTEAPLHEMHITEADVRSVRFQWEDGGEQS